MSTPQFDAIVVGSGITGGIAAKELTERGLTVLMIERGPDIPHQSGYTTETIPPWELPFRGYGDPRVLREQYPVQSKGRYFDEWTQKHFVNDRDHPYETTKEAPFQWRRSYNVGGRSLVWGRQTYRWSPVDFEANAKDGHGVDWPIRYDDLAPWYDAVERFIGVQGAREGVASLPDGKFQPAFPLMPVEQALRDRIKATYPDRTLTVARSAHLTQAKDGRSVCQNRGICARGCSFGAYFSTQSSSLPAAKATGRLTVVTDSVVDGLDFDPATRKVTGVRVLDTRTKKRTVYSSRVVFLNASTINTIGILLRSRTDAVPNGLANSSGVLGQYIMDHVNGGGAGAIVMGFQDKTTFGNRPTGIIVPRFRNIGKDEADFVRGYVFFGLAFQTSWRSLENRPGIGAPAKAALAKPGQWVMGLSTHGECLPQASNRALLAKSAVDKDGLPQMRVEFAHDDNARRMLIDSEKEAQAMLKLLPGQVIRSSHEPGLGGTTVHEMGGARMGRDPRTSVLNADNRAHDVDNLYITDGACMTSSGSVNPSLTYMALTARAADTAARLVKQGRA